MSPLFSWVAKVGGGAAVLRSRGRKVQLRVCRCSLVVPRPVPPLQKGSRAEPSRAVVLRRGKEKHPQLSSRGERVELGLGPGAWKLRLCPAVPLGADPGMAELRAQLLGRCGLALCSRLMLLMCSAEWVAALPLLVWAALLGFVTLWIS